MNALIQKTKLYFPPTRAGLVVRPRLLAQLNALLAPGRRLGLISAPAGSGKTTLVVQWLAAQPGRPAAWLSLDARDNRPPAFFAGFIAALQTIHPHAGKEALDLLALPGVSLEEVVTLLVNDLAAAPSPFVLVLDDLHHIADHAVHQALDLFLDAQPPGLRLLLLSREDPPLPLAQRRAGGQLVEIRQDDLRFTLPEAILFLNQSMGLDLAPRQVELLEARPEGWIAGLQLAALSLQRATDSDAFIRAFSGSHRFILDYLLEEVLSHQTEERQRFLVETSILERMCAPLCAAVTGRSVAAAQELLDGLDRANLFVVPLDEERCWYRYHHLFGDLLRARLAAGAPENTVQLCRRAATWHEENGDPRQAVEYALRAGDALYAARLIERHYAERWQMADLDFLALVNRLPPESVEERPSLCLNSAWLHVLGGQAERIPPFLEAAERALANPARQPEPADAANRAFARIIRAALDALNNRAVQLDQGLEEAFAAIPAQNAAMRNSVAVMLGTIATMQGDFARAIPYYQGALERDKRLGGTVAIALCVMRLVWIRQAEGKLSQALDLVVEHEAYVRRRGARRFYLGGVLNVMWAEILLERNRLDEAESQLRRGLHLLEDWPMPQTLTYGLGLLARLQPAAGRPGCRRPLPGRPCGFGHALYRRLDKARARLEPACRRRWRRRPGRHPAAPDPPPR